jgi:hypothetical protein
VTLRYTQRKSTSSSGVCCVHPSQDNLIEMNLINFLACKVPSAPGNGSVNCDANPVPHFGDCHFTCDQGYELVGYSRNICVNGEWIDDTPTCISKCSKITLFILDSSTSSKLFFLENLGKDNFLLIQCYYGRKPKLNYLYLSWIALPVLNCSF